MNAYQSKISLRLRHPSLDPSEITSALQLNPSSSGRAGEARTSPSGRQLQGQNQESYWTARLIEDRWPPVGLPDLLGRVLGQLAPHRSFFHEIRSQGGTVELFVGWFFDGNSGDVFDCDLLARMADLKIDLSLDVYGPDPLPSQPGES
jgi:hypothetical protein